MQLTKLETARLVAGGISVLLRREAQEMPQRGRLSVALGMVLELCELLATMTD